MNILRPTRSQPGPCGEQPPHTWGRLLSLSIAFTFLLSCLLSPPAVVGAEDDPPAATVDAAGLRDALLAAQGRISSISIVYMSDDYDPYTISELGKEASPEGMFLRRSVALKAPASILHMTAHGHKSLPWEDDPFQQRARIRDGHLYNEFPLNRSYYEAQVDLKAHGLPGSLPREFLFLATGIWPLSGVKPIRPDIEPYVLVEVAKSEAYCDVRPRQELIEGRWCHVLERPGRDRLWLDVERGCALMARETHASTTGRLAQRMELGGHREVSPGIWFPMWMTNIQYDHDASDPEKQRRIWKHARHDVLEVRINDVEDSAFAWEPPPGALRIMDNAPAVQTKPGGLDHIEQMAQWIRKYHRITPPGQSSMMLPAAVALGALALLLLLRDPLTAALGLRRRGEPSEVPIELEPRPAGPIEAKVPGAI